MRRLRRASYAHPAYPPLLPLPSAAPQDVQSRGTEVLLPVGCSDYDEWLLDALSVDRLLKQLRSKAAKLDLINACVTSSTSGSLAAAARRESLAATPPRGASSAMEDAEDYRRLMPGSGTPSAGFVGAGSGGAGDLGQEEGNDADSSVPQLRLKSLHVGASGGRRAGCRAPKGALLCIPYLKVTVSFRCSSRRCP